MREDDTAEDDTVLATVRASVMRRGLGVTMLALLGLLLVYTGIARPPAHVGWQAFLVVMGLIALWGAERMRRATRVAVELTEAGLRTSDGEEIAAMENIASVDRGAFAFKPSNGFILRLKSRAPGRWQPGLWWRMGPRVGIGGVTPGSHAKVMSDIIAAKLAEREMR
ncbi:MAG: hypothetical protein RIC49_12350 [Phycisphaerales bacterium]